MAYTHSRDGQDVGRERERGIESERGLDTVERVAAHIKLNFNLAEGI